MMKDTYLIDKPNSRELCANIATSDENLNTNAYNAHTNKIISLPEDEQNFDLYVQHNFEEVYEKFTKSKSRITCYFCNYISKYRILFNIQGEIHEHLRSEHADIVDSYDPDNYQFDNDQQEDFLALFVDSCNLWIMGNRPGRWYYLEHNQVISLLCLFFTTCNSPT